MIELGRKEKTNSFYDTRWDVPDSFSFRLFCLNRSFKDLRFSGVFDKTRTLVRIFPDYYHPFSPENFSMELK